MRRSTTMVALGALAAGLVPAPAGAVAPPEGQVFINEIHYDNDGTDAGEAIEVAGPAGTDLAGWRVVLYNGSGGAAYDDDPLSGTIGDQGGGFGTVSLTYPVNGIQNGAPDGIALVGPAGEVVQFLSYEGTFTAAGGPAAGMTSTDIGVAEGASTPAGYSVQLRGTGDTYGDFTWTTPTPSSFGAPNTDQRFQEGPGGGTDPAPDPCDIPVTHEIGAVQGEGDTSPVEDNTVTVEGVVVGDFQDPGQLGGAFIQDPDGDGHDATSDGIFVYDPGAPALVEGDTVRVTGTVDEFHGLTEITNVTAIGDCGDTDVPAATVLDLPADDATRERFEGMLVTIAEPVTATETYTLARYGELVVSADGRLYQPTNDGGDDAAEQAGNDQRRLIIDDASTVQNPGTVPFTDVDGEVIRLGDTLTGVEGVLSFGFDAWRLQPTGPPTVTRTSPRPASPDEVGGDVQVASFNVLNYFTTIDAPGAVTDTGHDPRGADSAEELERQRAKIVEAILALDAEIVGLMEIENDADDAAVDNLVDALNTAAGEARYAAIEEPDTGGGLFGTDAIKVAMIHQPDAVIPMGDAATSLDEAFANARPPLAQRFLPTGGGQPFSVVVNHFKSKGCGGATGENVDQGDGQGCYNADRVEQAEALVELLESLQDKEALIIGDLNSYGDEQPIDVLEAAGFVDLVDTRLPEGDQYSYVFQGQAGYLDHALASPRLARQITGVDIWHINADEALFLDYNTEFNPDGFYAPDAYRSSDHDPVLIGLTGQYGAVASASAPPSGAATEKAPGPAPVEVQLLALNDFHGALEEPGGSGGRIQTGADPDGAGELRAPTVDAGGAEFLATQLGELAAAQNKNNTITVAAGDLIGATPLLSAAFHDEPTIESLGLAGLDYASVGNHEFDEGADELLRIQNGGCHPVDGCADGTPYEGADFQYLSANAFVTETGEPLLAPYAIHQVQGVEIGFIGMTLEGTKEIVSQDGVAGLDFTDEIETANRYAAELRAQGVETIVVLVHQGGWQTGEEAWDVNGCNGLDGPIVDIAEGMDDAIDVVVSGHTHQAYNCEVDGKLVTSASSNGRLVTDIDLSIDRRTGDVLTAAANNVIVTRDLAPDPAQTELIGRYREALGPIAGQVVGTAAEALTTLQEILFDDVRGESALGNLIADAQLAATDDEYDAIAAFMNPGGVRADLDTGDITYEEAFTVQPFANNLVTMDLTGEQLYCLLEQQFQVGRTLYPSASVSYLVDPAGQTAPAGADPCTGTRVVADSLTIGGAAVVAEGSYRITVNNFLAGGGDGFTVLTGGENMVTGPIDLDAFTAYLGGHSPVSAPELDRIQVANFY